MICGLLQSLGEHVGLSGMINRTMSGVQPHISSCKGTVKINVPANEVLVSTPLVAFGGPWQRGRKLFDFMLPTPSRSWPP